jgi:hypothetical protein
MSVEPPPDSLPDVLHFWEHTWTKRGEVWEGPPVSDPALYLPLALVCRRIEVQGEDYVIVDPWLTMAAPRGSDGGGAGREGRGRGGLICRRSRWSRRC